MARGGAALGARELEGALSANGGSETRERRARGGGARALHRARAGEAGVERAARRRRARGASRGDRASRRSSRSSRRSSRRRARDWTRRWRASLPSRARGGATRARRSCRRRSTRAPAADLDAAAAVRAADAHAAAVRALGAGATPPTSPPGAIASPLGAIASRLGAASAPPPRGAQATPLAEAARHAAAASSPPPPQPAGGVAVDAPDSAATQTAAEEMELAPPSARARQGTRGCTIRCGRRAEERCRASNSTPCSAAAGCPPPLAAVWRLVGLARPADAPTTGRRVPTSLWSRCTSPSAAASVPRRCRRRCRSGRGAGNRCVCVNYS